MYVNAHWHKFWSSDYVLDYLAQSETVRYLSRPSKENEAVKPGTHPEYTKATITCACGHAIETYSTVGSYSIDVCSACHPFFTGKQKLLDTAGRVDRFRRKYGKKNA